MLEKPTEPLKILEFYFNFISLSQDSISFKKFYWIFDLVKIKSKTTHSNSSSALRKNILELFLNLEKQKELKNCEYFEIILTLLSYYDSMKLKREQKVEVVKVHCKKFDLNFDENDSQLRPILSTFKHLFNLAKSN